MKKIMSKEKENYSSKTRKSILQNAISTFQGSQVHEKLANTLNNLIHDSKNLLGKRKTTCCLFYTCTLFWAMSQNELQVCRFLNLRRCSPFLKLVIDSFFISFGKVTSNGHLLKKLMNNWLVICLWRSAKKNWNILGKMPKFLVQKNS